MLSTLPVFIQLAITLGGVMASSAAGTASTPTVTLDKAIVLGTTNGSVTSYIGIPYVQPPVGDLRLRLPVLLESYNGTINATQSAATQCPQLQSADGANLPPEIAQDVLAYSTTIIPNIDVPEDEDCLTINVQVPAGAKAEDKLPVVVLIYGGGFTVGSTAWFPGQDFVQHSVEAHKPVVFVAMNYRLNVFGFLGGKEIKDAGVGNLGLHDQRAALRWINRYVSAEG